MYCREREVRKCSEESSMYILMYISLDSVYLNLIFILAHIQKIYIYQTSCCFKTLILYSVSCFVYLFIFSWI